MLLSANLQGRALIARSKPSPNERDHAGTAQRPARTAARSPATDWSWLDAISGPLDPDMIEAALEQHRPALDALFPLSLKQ
jgi:hypothetical protein